jgi:hypothetical protein
VIIASNRAAAVTASRVAGSALRQQVHTERRDAGQPAKHQRHALPHRDEQPRPQQQRAAETAIRMRADIVPDAASTTNAPALSTA